MGRFVSFFSFNSDYRVISTTPFHNENVEQTVIADSVRSAGYLSIYDRDDKTCTNMHLGLVVSTGHHHPERDLQGPSEPQGHCRGLQELRRVRWENDKHRLTHVGTASPFSTVAPSSKSRTASFLRGWVEETTLTKNVQVYPEPIVTDCMVIDSDDDTPIATRRAHRTARGHQATTSTAA